MAREEETKRDEFPEKTRSKRGADRRRENTRWIPVGSAVNHAATDLGRAPRPPVEPPKDRSLSRSVPGPNSRGSSRAPSHPNTEEERTRRKNKDLARMKPTPAEPPEWSSW